MQINKTWKNRIGRYVFFVWDFLHKERCKMRILAQIGIVLFVCLLGEAIAAVLPFPFPASVIGMVLLFLLLACKWLKPRHIQEKSNFLLSNMAFFFIPAGVGLLDYLDVLKANLIPCWSSAWSPRPSSFWSPGGRCRL